MISAVYRVLLGVFIGVCSVRLTHYWGAHPDNFPPLLRWLSLRFVELFDWRTLEEAANLEQAFVLTVSLLLVCTITGLGALAIRHWR